MTTISATMNFLNPALNTEKLFAKADEIKHGRKDPVSTTSISTTKRAA